MLIAVTLGVVNLKRVICIMQSYFPPFLVVSPIFTPKLSVFALNQRQSYIIIVVKNFFFPASLYGERGRCHFCQLLCPDRKSLTEHLKSSHQPPKHSLCENCENFFHICAIARHREKCKARYQTDR